MAVSGTHHLAMPPFSSPQTIRTLEQQLSEACYQGDENTVLELLKNPSIDVNAYDEDGNTPLLSASLGGQVDVVRVLIADPRTNVNAPDKRRGHTTLYWASLGGLVDVVRVLVAHPDTDVNAKDFSGNTHLHRACQYKQVDVVRVLLENGAFPSSQVERNFIVESGLLPETVREAINSGRPLDSIRYLLGEELHGCTRGVPHAINAPDGVRGYTALHCAVAKGRDDVVEYLLLREDTDVNAQTKKGFTPFDFAEMMGAEGLANQLRTRGGMPGEGVRPAPMPEGYVSSATADNLPNELWEWEILSRLGKPDLASTACVNRGLNAQVNALRNGRRRQQARKESEPSALDSARERTGTQELASDGNQKKEGALPSSISKGA